MNNKGTITVETVLVFPIIILLIVVFIFVVIYITKIPNNKKDFDYIDKIYRVDSNIRRAGFLDYVIK